MRKRGVTLVEITVAMAIFVTITTLVVGAFVTVTRMKALSSVLRESQQKIRVANEMVTRLARQANTVTVTESGKTLTLNFSQNNWVTVFKIKQGTDGNYSLFINDNSSTDVDLLGGVTMINNDNTQFEKVGGIPPILNFTLDGKITGVPNNPYYSNDFKLDNSVILENVR